MLLANRLDPTLATLEASVPLKLIAPTCLPAAPIVLEIVVVSLNSTTPLPAALASILVSSLESEPSNDAVEPAFSVRPADDATTSLNVAPLFALTVMSFVQGCILFVMFIGCFIGNFRLRVNGNFIGNFDGFIVKNPTGYFYGKYGKFVLNNLAIVKSFYGVYWVK